MASSPFAIYDYMMYYIFNCSSNDAGIAMWINAVSFM